MSTSSLAVGIAPRDQLVGVSQTVLVLLKESVAASASRAWPTIPATAAASAHAAARRRRTKVQFGAAARTSERDRRCGIFSSSVFKDSLTVAREMQVRGHVKRPRTAIKAGTWDLCNLFPRLGILHPVNNRLSRT